MSIGATAAEKRTVHHLIGGRSVASEDGRTFETRDPHDDALLGTVARARPGTASWPSRRRARPSTRGPGPG